MEVFIGEEAAQKATRFLTGRQVAWMIHEYFKVQTSLSWTSLKVELKNDNVQLFNTRWDETTIAMKKQFDDEFYDRLLQTVKAAEAIAVAARSRYCSKG